MSSLRKVLYTDDLGNQYRVTIRDAGPDGPSLATFGWASDNPTKPRLPRWLKMRYVMFHRFSGKGARTRTIGNRTCLIWQHSSQRINLPDADGTVGDWKSTSWFEEERRKHTD